MAKQLFFLVVLHFVIDFGLQTDFIAKNKAPGASSIWPWALAAHSSAHAAGVGVVLSPLFGTLEFVAHALTDLLKSRGAFGRGPIAFHIDQTLHLGTKLIWLIGFTALSGAAP